jgi:hypothetical protein
LIPVKTSARLNICCVGYAQKEAARKANDFHMKNNQVGFPEFWQKAHDKYPNAFKAIHDLMLIQQAIFLKSLSEPLHKVIRHLSKITMNSLGALTTLVLNGYGNDAMKIARGMFENAINVCYLQKYPAELDNFMDYYWVQKHRMLEYIQKTDAALYASRSSEAAVITGEFSRVKPKYTNKQGRLRGSWSAQSIGQRAADVGMADHYATFYNWSSSMHHGDISGMISQAEGNDVDVAPSFCWLDTALITGHMAALRCIGAYDEVAMLGMNTEIQAAMEAFQSAWDKTNAKT